MIKRKTFLPLVAVTALALATTGCLHDDDDDDMMLAERNFTEFGACSVRR